MQLQFRVEGKGAMQLKANLLLDPMGCTVGRGGVPFALRSDKQCSRAHALIYPGIRGEIWVKDLGSRNGTWLNGRRIRCARLKVGDVLRVGFTTMVLTGIAEEPGETQLPVMSLPISRKVDIETQSQICNQFPESLYISPRQ